MVPFFYAQSIVFVFIISIMLQDKKIKYNNKYVSYIIKETFFKHESITTHISNNHYSKSCVYHYIRFSDYHWIIVALHDLLVFKTEKTSERSSGTSA